MDAKKGLWGTLKRYGLLMLGMLGVIYFAIAVGFWGYFFWYIVIEHGSYISPDWPMFWHAVPAVVFLIAFSVFLRKHVKGCRHAGWEFLLVTALSVLCCWVEMTAGWYQSTCWAHARGEFYMTWWHTLCPDVLYCYEIDSCYGVIDTDGNYIVEPKYEWISHYHNGYAAFRAGDKQGFIDIDGHVTIEPKYADVGNFSEGLAAVAVKNKNEDLVWGYVDERGRMVIEPRFRSAEPFSEGLAAVSIPYVLDQETSSAKGRNPDWIQQNYEIWGYIDKTGQFVIEPEYYHAQPFSQGLAAVQDYNNNHYYISPDGQVAIPGPFSDANSFVDGFARVCDLSGKYYFIDHKGNRLGETTYDYALDFSEKYAVIGIHDKYGYVTQDGKMVIEPQFEEAGDFHDGAAPVQVDDLWGYIDTAGKWIIPPRFSFASLFSEGVGYCETDDRRLGYRRTRRVVYVNSSGDIILDVPYETMSAGEQYFSDGPSIWGTPANGRMAVIKNGKWGYLDTSGQIAIKPKFDGTIRFIEGRAVVSMNIGEPYEYYYEPNLISILWHENLILMIGYGLAVLGLIGAIVFVKKRGGAYKQ